MWHFGKELHQSFQAAQARFSDLNDQVQQSLSGIRLTRALGRESVVEAEFNACARAANEASQKVANTDSKYTPTFQLAISMSFFLSVTGGAWLIHHQQLTLGELTSFVLYLGYMIWPMFAVGWLLNLVERGQAAYARLEELFDVRPAIKDKGEFDQPVTPSISVNIPRFGYDQSAYPTLKNVHFNVAAGETRHCRAHRIR